MGDLGNWLRTELKRHGLTQMELAVQAGVAQATISDILRKGHVPRVATLFRLADQFGVDRTEVLRVAGYLRPADDLPGFKAGPPGEEDPLVWQLVEEFRLVPDEWKPEVINLVRMFQRLAKRAAPRLAAAKGDPEVQKLHD